MEENKDNKNFTHYLNEIETQCDSLLSFPEDSVSKSALKIKEDVHELKSGFKGIKIALLAMSIISGILLIVTMISLGSYYNMKSIVNSTFEARKDSILDLTNGNDTLSFFRRDGKILTYSQVSKERDALEDSLDKLNVKMEHDAFLLNFAMKRYKISFKEEKKDNITTYTIKSGVIEDCYDQNNKLEEKHQNETADDTKVMKTIRSKTKPVVDSLLKQK